MTDRAFQSGLLEGYATPEGTLSYFTDAKKTYTEYSEHLWFRKHARTGLSLSRLGFGGYRITSGFRPHFDALREAFLSGINIVDTAANYGDGSSEQLVGDVLRELIGANRIRRDQIAIVTKVGYLQGKALEMAQGTSVPDLVKYAPDCFHCIHPDFLRGQIQLSRYRLGIKTIDFLLLHNPEYYLLDSSRRELPHAQARSIYEARLKLAFSALEEMVQRGAIRWYGVSSNTLANSADDYAATHLDFLIKAGGPHFQVVQFPANLLETDFRYNRKASGGTISSVASKAGLFTMGNRPFNAAGASGLVRLTRLPEAPPDGGDSAIAEFQKMQGRLAELESRMHEVFGSRFRFGPGSPPFSELLETYRDSFKSPDHLRASIPRIAQVFDKTVRQIQTAAESLEERLALDQYVKIVNALLHHWEKYVEILQHQKMEEFEKLLGSFPAFRGLPLALQTLQFILAGEVPAVVLAGMRKVTYVRQLVRAFATTPPSESDGLGLLTRLSGTLDKF